MSNNPTSSAATKHISIRDHFIREKVEDGLVRLQYVSTNEQLADGLTKPLAKVSFFRLRDTMLLGTPLVSRN